MNLTPSVSLELGPSVYIANLVTSVSPLPAVTVIWVSPRFGHPRTQIPSDMGIPDKDAQNTDSVKYSRLGEVNSFKILKTIYVLIKCCVNKCLVNQQG